MTFQTRLEKDGNVIIIQIPKRLDLNKSEDLRNLLSEFTKQGIYKWVLDLHNTEYLDSSGLGAFVSQIAACRTNNGDIHLAAPNEYIQSLLRITHLNRVLKSFDSVHSAINGFS